MIRSAAFAAAVGGLAFTAAPGVAEGWSITTLETMTSQQACLDKAQAVVTRYLGENGGGSTGADPWAFYAYDLEPGMQDAVIMCPTGGGGAINAVLVVQSESDSDSRNAAADGLVAMWNTN